MDRDNIAGKGKQIKGKVREGMGKATGNKKQVLIGKADQATGKVQEEYGKAKDTLRKKR